MYRIVLDAWMLLLLLAASAFAGDVTASGGKTLKLKGSEDADVITITPATVGALLITPGAGTTVNGSASATVLAVSGGISAALGDGDDDIEIDSVDLDGGVTIKASKGNDRARIVNSIVGGKTKIDLGGDDNALSLCNSILAGKVDVKSGKSSSGAVTTTCPGAELDANSGGGSAILVHFVTAVSLALKAGTATGVTIDNTVVSTDAKVKTSGSGNGVALCNVSVDGKLALKIASNPTDSATASCGSLVSGMATGNSAIMLGNMSIAEGLQYKGGSGGDAALIVDTGIDGPTKLDAGAGINALSVSATSFTKVTAKFGKETDVTSWTQVSVDDDAKISLGAGSNVLTMGMTTIHGDLTIKAGGGDDVIDTAGTSVDGTTKVDAGKGMNTVS